MDVTRYDTYIGYIVGLELVQEARPGFGVAVPGVFGDGDTEDFDGGKSYLVT